jgi:hypothetical protein
MEPKAILLLYSKYSETCNNLMNSLKTNNINLPMITFFCIDNEEIRRRILASNIVINLVPCILVTYINNIEKYEGPDALRWLDNLINQLYPPPPIKQPPPPHLKKAVPIDDRIDAYAPKEESEEEQEETKEEEPEERPVQVPKSKKKVTPIDELDEKEEYADRHKNQPQPRRVKKNNSEYEEDENLFADEPLENRKIERSIREEGSKKQIVDAHGTIAKSLELAKAREELESKQNKRKPIEMRTST